MNDYYHDPKTAVIEGLSSALASIDSNREESESEELNLTDKERVLIESEITYYILSRFDLTWKLNISEGK